MAFGIDSLWAFDIGVLGSLGGRPFFFAGIIGGKKSPSLDLALFNIILTFGLLVYVCFFWFLLYRGYLIRDL
jgi:hypothetical protein